MATRGNAEIAEQIGIYHGGTEGTETIRQASTLLRCLARSGAVSLTGTMIPIGDKRRQMFFNRLRRPRLRFSLRAMMMLVTVLAVWLGWMAHRANQQKRAVAAIVGAGGSVYYDWENLLIAGENAPYLSTPGLLLLADSSAPGPDWLRAQVGDDYFQTVEHVAISAAQLDDSMISELQSLPRLKTIVFDSDSVDDALISTLKAKLPNARIYFQTPLHFEVESTFESLSPWPSDMYSTDLLVD